MSPLLRRLLLGIALLIGAVLLSLGTLAALVSTSSGSRWAVARVWALAGDAALQVDIDSSSGTLLRGMQVRGLRLSMAGNPVRIDRLEARWNPFSLLGGTFVLDSLQVQGLQVQYSSAAGADTAPLGADPFAALLPLPLGVDLRSLILEQTSITLDGQPNIEIPRLALAASLAGSVLQMRELTLDASPLQVQGFVQADLQGGISLRGTLDWQLAAVLPYDLASPAGRLTLSGTLDTLGLTHVLHSPVQIDTQGSVVLNLLQGTGGQRLDLTHSVGSQSLAALLPANGFSLQLREALINTTGWLDALALDGQGTVQVLNAQGSALFSDLVLRANAVLEGSSMQLEQLSVSTDSGSLSTSGELRWGTGLEAAVTYSLSETDAGRYAALLPAGVLPGPLSSTGSLNVSVVDTVTDARLVIDTLEGRLNDYPLSGSGALSYADNRLAFNALYLRSGNNTLQLDGDWAETLSLRIALEAPDLGTLSPLLSGSFGASAEIAGTAAAPQLTLRSTGTNLRVGQMQIASLQGQARYENGVNTLELRAQTLQAGALQARSVVLQGEGQAAAHRLSLQLDSQELQADIALTGALAGLTAGETLTWQGAVARGRLDSELGLWQLSQPATMSWSDGQGSLGAHCWAQGDSTLCLDATSDAAGALQASASLSGFNLERFNAQPDILSSRWLPALPAGYQVQGFLNATVQATGAAGDSLQDLQLDFGLAIEGGSLELLPVTPGSEGAFEEGAPAILRRLALRTATLDGSRTASAWDLQSTLEFTQPASSLGAGLQGTARTRARLSPSGALEGQVALQFDALQWLETLVPALHQVEGRLTGLAILGGTLQEPHLGATLNLLDGALQVPALGLQLHSLTASLLSDNSDRMAIQGEASSGTGTLQFFSAIDAPFSNARRLRLTLQGEDFTLVQRPELQMAITPDLVVSASATGVDITGTLALPLLDARITSLPESAIDVSADTVLVTQSTEGPLVRNAAETSLGPLDGLPLTAQISLQLGEAVHFAGWGLDTDLSGSLEITQRATGAPLTYGELTVTQGSYQTYGRTLNIEHGKLLFFGSYDNPALDIRATRETEDVKVGVQMNGTLRNIRSQLFSTPTLPDGDIIAVMLTGRPLAEVGDQDSSALVGAITTLGINQGQNLTNQIRNQLGLDTLAITSTGDVANSSLTLGKYLTPRIFIQYGIGLFETESTLAVDYTLSERVKLEAKSGSTQSLDITYTVER